MAVIHWGFRFHLRSGKQKNNPLTQFSEDKLVKIDAKNIEFAASTPQVDQQLISYSNWLMQKDNVRTATQLSLPPEGELYTQLDSPKYSALRGLPYDSIAARFAFIKFFNKQLSKVCCTVFTPQILTLQHNLGDTALAFTDWKEAR